jgi:hypothetical protein
MMQVLIALDQLVNACLGGFADETLSARCWRLRSRQPYRFLQPVIDGLFFWQERHCEQSHISELRRLQSPPSERR